MARIPLPLLSPYLFEGFKTLLLSFLLLAVGLTLVVFGADWLVKGAVSIAKRFGISPLVIGLTIVGIGTSSPELAVSVDAAMSGKSDLAVGNVVGSNIFNVLFILGLSALIIPLRSARQLIVFDVPVMIGVSLLIWWLASDLSISRLEGAVMLVLLGGYLFMLARTGHDNHEEEEQLETAVKGLSVAAAVGLLAVGFGALIFGADLLVKNAVAIAKSFGVSELVIGLTIVAAGTSLPEVATSITAAIKGERDLAIGNVVGSNTFNILGVLGLSSVVAPAGLEVPAQALAHDLPIMVGVALICLPMMLSFASISRLEGGLMFLAWCSYTFWLIGTSWGGEWKTLATTIAIGCGALLVMVIAGELLLSLVKSKKSAAAT